MEWQPSVVASLQGSQPVPDLRNDRAAIERLVAFLEARREQLVSAGRSTADADDLLEKLRPLLSLVREHTSRQ